MDFLDDEDKMRDYFKLTKDEFLKSYSYLKEEDYDATTKALQVSKLSILKELLEQRMQELLLQSKCILLRVWINYLHHYSISSMNILRRI